MKPPPTLMIVVLFTVVSLTADATQEQSLELVGGRWFDGQGFVDRTVYVTDGYFVAAKPEGETTRVNLEGRYIVPPFADGHSHNLWSEWEWQRVHDGYLREGTFYVLVMGNARSGSDHMRARFLSWDTIDIAYGEGVVTSTLGYPFMHYEPRAMGFHDPSTWKENLPAIRHSRRMENDGYWFMDSVSDVDAKLPAILADRTTHLKIILFRSERFAELSADTTRISHRGLNPELVQDIVSRAHAAGIRVAAHIETPHDFELAVRAGADIIAHVPGYNLAQGAQPEQFRLSEAMAQLAADQGVTVTPTAFFGSRNAVRSPEWNQRRDDLLRHNLRLLKRHGVSIASGTDVYSETARAEIGALAALDLWSNAELLRLWAITTPRLVFPSRRIGSLEPGFEASFLALECDPIADFGCTDRIALRFKQGRFLP
jgi:imidazolonepropionase-like amidohydrolase